MPSLNVEFTVEELEKIRAVAKREDTNLKTFVHDATMLRVSDRKSLIEQAARNVASKSTELNERLA